MMFDTSKSVKLCSICHTDVLLCLEHTRGDIILPVSSHLGIPSHNNFSSINLFLCVTELPSLCAAICSGSGHSNGDCLSSDSRTGWSAGLNTDNCLSVWKEKKKQNFPSFYLPLLYNYNAQNPQSRLWFGKTNSCILQRCLAVRFGTSVPRECILMFSLTLKLVAVELYLS